MLVYVATADADKGIKMIEVYMLLNDSKCVGNCFACPLYHNTPTKAKATDSDMFYISLNPNRPMQCNALEWNSLLPEFDALTEKIKQMQTICQNCFAQNARPVSDPRMVLHLYSCGEEYFFPKSLKPCHVCLKKGKYNWILLRPRDNNYKPENLATLIYEARGIPVKQY